ncbi:transmembrane protein, putative (macronuclear) [Tetrahymena thermophila SB210]|uniref:Transmembrane protein, putative n=1 Tax=Tetrahymena thermophila (strain SB210) TaxID=312017 RepID=I7M2P0_TETTS|nr:transmembrane protein, putative [Tetrahymena thermophila SB210]EAS00909.2 transmembrane protein, putative [Tetrahymena thermophila SB210]|eukprot:XP_001021155.2 transmembrane protein, putative [Tetrahymena thermophila SB210]
MKISKTFISMLDSINQYNKSINLIFLKFICLYIIWINYVTGGRVSPYGSQFIVLSSTNPNTIADYYFSMTFDTALPSTGYVEILFPQNQYQIGLTPAKPVIYAPYPNVASFSKVNLWSVIIGLPNWPANTPIQIMVSGVYNPSKEGGTGQFQISTLASYDFVSNPIVPGTVLDQSKHFTVVGLSKPSTNLISASVNFNSSSSQQAGQISIYNFYMVPSSDLPYNVDFRITFPSIYSLTYVIPSQCGSVANSAGLILKGGFYCQVLSTSPNVLTIKGNGSPIIKGTQVALALFQVQNPQVSAITDLFKFEILLASTNSTLEVASNVLGLYIQPGIITNINLQLYYPLYQMFTGFTRTFVLQFKPTNPFIAARIVTDFQLITSCQITSGLLDTSLNSNSICTPYANIMLLSNFQSYVRSQFGNEFVQVQFVAQIKSYPVTTTNILSTQPVSISTFLDQNMLTLVDQDNSTASTQLAITQAPPTTGLSVVLPATPITLSNLQTSTQSVTLTVSIQKTNLPSGATSCPATFYIEIPEDFSGIPACQFGGTNYQCSLQGGLIKVAVTGYTLNVATVQTLTISNLANPSIPDNYNIRANIYFSDTTGLQYIYTLNQVFAIISPPLSSPATYTLSTQQLQSSMLFFVFAFKSSLPSGVKTLADPFTQFSYIDIIVSGTSNSYGLSSIPDLSIIDCISLPQTGTDAQGLTNAPGYQIQCSIFQNLYPGSIVIRVQNYDQLQSIQTSQNRKIKIGVPVTQAASSDTPQYKIQIYISTNKIVRLYQSLPLTNITPVPTGSSLPAATSITTTPNPPDMQQSYQSQVPLTGFPGQAIGTYNGIFFQLAPGYVFDVTQQQISVSGVSYTYLTDFFYLSRMNYILIITKSALPSGNVNIIIQNIISPNYSYATNVNNLYVSTNSQYVAVYSVVFNTQVLTDSTLALSIDYATPQILWAKYTFKFTVNMPNVNILEFSFPASYQIALNDAYLQVINLVNIQNQSVNKQILVSTPSANLVQISQFTVIDPNQKVSITLTAIANPAAGTYQITVTQRYANGAGLLYAIRQTKVNAVISGAAFTPEVINFLPNSINALPNNIGNSGIYIFQFQTTLLIPKGSVITITFPSDYTLLYQKQQSFIQCSERNSIIYMSNCAIVTGANQIQMTTYADSNPALNVILEYYGLALNPSSLSSNFNLQINYKSTLVFSTGTSVSPTISTKALPLASSSLNYYPQNEGERAYYEFTIQFSTVTAISSTQSILVYFPLNYDNNLGPYKLIITSEQLQGALKYKQYRRQLVIYGFYSMTITQPITIKIFGIVNPNRTTNQVYVSELFGIGLLDVSLPKALHGYNLIEAAYQTIPNISPQLTPGGINFVSIASTNQYARQTGNFTFVIDPLQKVLSSQNGGQIYFDFPQDFIVDSYGGTCSINQSFSFFSNCYMNDENLRFYYQTINPQWDSSVNGYISATISLIRTPDSSGPTNNFIAYNYDSINQVVLGRSYPNLFIASLSFSYQGKLITVNNDQPYNLEVGSFSDTITIAFNVNIVNYSAETTITLTPNVLDPSIIIQPFPVVLQYKSTSVTFKIAAPRSILLKTFYITWSKTGDTFPPTYADLRRTQINMVSGTLLRSVRIENIPYIPQDGESYPLYLRVPNPPYTGLTVQICFDNLFSGKQDFQNFEASVNTTNVNFNIQTNTMAYTVFFRKNLTVSSVPIYYQLSGVDMASYQLFIYDVDNDQISADIPYDPLVGQTINKIAANYVAPNFINVNIQQQTVGGVLQPMITRTSVTLSIQADQKGFLFYVVANKRIPTPTFISTSQPSSNYTLSFSNPIYGVNYIRKTNLQTQFTITNLNAGIDYEIYIYIMNMNLVNNANYYKLAFSTLQPQNIAAFTMKITQSSILSDVKQEYITKMASLVSISPSRIIERQTKCLSINLDGSNSANVMYWNLLLLPDPTNEDYLTTPINIVAQLNNRIQAIQQFIPRLDVNTPFIMSNLSLNIPQFQIAPYMANKTINSVTINVGFSYCGTLIAVGIPRLNSENSTITNTTSLLSQEAPGVIYPTSYEISQGLNMTNLPVNQNLFIQSYINQINSPFNITFSNLSDRTVYDFYLSTINDFPQFNYLLNDNSVVKLSIKTLKNKIPLNIYTIQKGSYLEICLTLLVFLIIFI